MNAFSAILLVLVALEPSIFDDQTLGPPTTQPSRQAAKPPSTQPATEPSFAKNKPPHAPEPSKSRSVDPLDIIPESVPQGERPARPAQRIVFVIKGSGSMLNKIADVKREVSNAIFGLNEKQRFDIIIFQDGKAIPFARSMVSPTKSVQAQAHRWLQDFTTVGSCEPDVGVAAAMKLSPDLIWLVTDGALKEGGNSIDAVHRLVAGRPVRINTAMLFVSLDDECRQNTWLLAHENGGVCLGPDGKDAPDPRPPAKTTILVDP